MSLVFINCRPIIFFEIATFVVWSNQSASRATAAVCTNCRILGTEDFLNSNLVQAERLEEPAEEEDLWDITVSGAFSRKI